MNNVEHLEESPENFFLESISMASTTASKSKSANKTWSLTGILKNTRNNGQLPVDFKVDSGSCVTAIPENLYSNKLGKLQFTNLRLHGAGQNILKTVGKINVELQYNNKSINVDIFVIKNLKTPLLGLPAIEKLNILQRINMVEHSSEKINWKEKFPKLFTGLGCMKQSYHIKLKDDAKPFSISTPRRIPFSLQKEVKKTLDQMVSAKIINPITEATEFCSPMVIVPKKPTFESQKHGKEEKNIKVRICNDYTELNKSVIRERTILPSVEESLEKISGGRFFSTLDANSGFHQVKLSQELSKLTTFITPWGRYRYLRMCMGITSAPEVYARMMSQLVDHIPGVAVLLDDICVSGSTKREHDDRLTAVLKILEKNGVTLNAEKCQFDKTKIRYLGYIVDADGIQPDEEKIRAIKEYPAPNDITQLRRFLGMVNHLGKFLENLADKTQPLRELLNKKNAWIWSEAQEKAFQRKPPKS